MKKTTLRLKKILVLTCFLILFGGLLRVSAQTPTDFTAERDRAIRLVNEKKFDEALPLLEKLSQSKEADGQIFLGLGLVYWRLQDQIKDRPQRKQTRLKARNAWIKARELGVSIPDIDLILASIKEDGGDRNESDNEEAQIAFNEAGQAFIQGDYKKAVEKYEKAAMLDPQWYEAVLYTGNTFYALKEYEKAGVWFARAIVIDPNRETAYRYWADGLFKSGKEKEAVDKYLEAIIAEPYGGSAWRGLVQYAQVKDLKLAHPKINIPVNVSSSGKGETNIILGIGGKDDDGSFAWTMYGISRAVWQGGKDGKLSESFSKAYPNEKVYRHSLAEEVEALKLVLETVKDGKKEVKNLDPSLVKLKKLADEGLLESYILMARADVGIKQDYPAYRQNSREKLKRYLSEYVMKNGGN